MDSYFLDSSVIIEYLRNNKEVISFIDDFPHQLSSGYIVKAELYEGVYLSKNGEKTKKQLETFFQGLDKIYGVNDSTSHIFGKVRAKLRQAGMLIEDFDILIASICMANNLPLITLNTKHFARIEGLKIYLPDDIN